VRHPQSPRTPVRGALTPREYDGRDDEDDGRDDDGEDDGRDRRRRDRRCRRRDVSSCTKGCRRATNRRRARRDVVTRSWCPSRHMTRREGTSSRFKADDFTWIKGL